MGKLGLLIHSTHFGGKPGILIHSLMMIQGLLIDSLMMIQGLPDLWSGGSSLVISLSRKGFIDVVLMPGLAVVLL